MKKDRKVSAHLGESETQHLFHRGADHQVIPVTLGQSQQAIPYRPSYQINLHAHSPSINLPR